MTIRTTATVFITILYVITFNSSYAIPPNAHASGSGWKCNTNYKQIGQQCKKLSPAELKSISEKFDTAISFDRQRKFKESFKIYLPLAESGHVAAQYNLADMYGRGQGVSINPERAFSWYEKAALQGHALSQYYLGFYYLRGEGTSKDAKKGFYWMEQSAKQGFKLAQHHLGIIYGAGTVIDRDHNKAIVWHRKAAEQGVANSQYYTAFYYCIGFETAPKNLQTCASWAKKAQENGSKKALKLRERYELWKFD